MTISDHHNTLFPVMDDTKIDDQSLPAFMVSTTRGFLPRADPIVDLPEQFEAVQSLLERMPIRKLDGTPGLLAFGTLGDTVLAELPDLTDAIELYKGHLPLMTALYRDYSFLASAYLLEPCHMRHMRGEEYGLGRQILPACIARPIAKVAAIAGFKPFMEYAGSYALFNYKLANPNEAFEYSNLRLIRAFEHGLDPTSSEAGFVLVHVDMVKNSGPLIAGAMKLLESCQARDRSAFNQGMQKVVTAMTKVNAVMETMWNKSKPGEYTNYRTFIFGITSQSMFPNGVVYEGVSEEPLSFRGESGANDSQIPLCDNILQIRMPDTPLTSILQDFRAYRPGNHREFLEWTASAAADAGVQAYALEDAESASLYLRALDQVRDFRWRHWCFTREYILKKTRHPTATGGSPIVTWLPNQLRAVLDLMDDVAGRFKDATTGAVGGGLKGCEDIVDLVARQKDMLDKEVKKYCAERKVDSGSDTAGAPVSAKPVVASVGA